MDKECTAAERGQRMLRDGGYVRHRDGGDIHQDKMMVRKAVRQHENHEHGGKHTNLKLKKGGPIKGEKPAEHPGRRHRAHGGGIDADAQINRRVNPSSDAPSKLARGGKPGHKGGIGKVNIVIGHPGAGAPGPMAAPAVSPPVAAPPPRPSMMPPPGAAPGMAGPPPAPRPMMPPPGAGMPPPGMVRRAGGRIRDELGRFSGGAI